MKTSKRLLRTLLICLCLLCIYLLHERKSICQNSSFTKETFGATPSTAVSRSYPISRSTEVNLVPCRPDLVGNTITVTMFTTFQPTEEKSSIHENVLRNWVELGPCSRLIYHRPREDSGGPRDNISKQVERLAASLGWAVYDVPKQIKSLPVLRLMFMHAQNVSRTQYYGYANSDILFSGLMETLTTVHGYNLPTFIITGRRRNVEMKSLQRKNILTKKDVAHVAKESDIFMKYAFDYFVTPSSYPWKSIPDLVIGRSFYDNWLVSNAILNRRPVIDATHTILAVHQTGKDGNFAGQRNPINQNINLNITLEGHFTGLGKSDCFPLQTLINNKSLNLELQAKNISSTGCDSVYRRRHINMQMFTDLLD